MLAEEAKRRGFGAVQTIAEIHLIQIELEELVLAELALQTPRQHRFLQLPEQRLVRRQKTLPRELLCQRTPALRGAMRTQVRRRSREDPNEIDTAVIVEALVFDGDDGVYEVG
jgi:hypothetical protein